MEIIVRVDTNSPPAVDALKREAAYLLWLADNLPGFLANAPAANAFFDTAKCDTQEVPPPPPPVDSGAQVPPPPTTTAQVPPPPSPGPIEPTTQVPPPPSGALPELDSKGYPWDARIHAQNKSKTKGNEWKKAQKVDPALVLAVEQEHRNAAAAALGNVPPPPSGASQVPPPPIDTGVQVPPPPPPGAAVSAVSDMAAIGAAVTAGHLTVDEVMAACERHGHAHLGTLGGDPAAAKRIVDEFRMFGKQV